MRESTKYLKTVPMKSLCQILFSFLIILGILRFIESRAVAYGPIHDSLEYYVLLLALLPSLAGLMAMLENYFTMRLSETNLITYLGRLGITA